MAWHPNVGPWPNLILIAPEDDSQAFLARRRPFIHQLPYYVDKLYEMVGEDARGEHIRTKGADVDTVRFLADWLNHKTIIFGSTNATTQDQRDTEVLKVIRLAQFAEHWVLSLLQNIATKHFDERTKAFGLSSTIVNAIFRGGYKGSPLRAFVFQYLARDLARSFCWPQEATGWPGLGELERLTAEVPVLKAAVIKRVTAHMQDFQMTELENLLVDDENLEKATKKRKL